MDFEPPARDRRGGRGLGGVPGAGTRQWAPYSLSCPLPPRLRPCGAHGLRAAHPRPLVSLGKRTGQPFTSYRTSPAKAWRFPELEYANAGSSVAALVLDCDDAEAMQRGMATLPDPNWIVWRVANDHAHPVWTLAAPVHRYPRARPEPLIYLSRIADYYTGATGADAGYNGVLAHNPRRAIARPNTGRHGAARRPTAWTISRA